MMQERVPNGSSVNRVFGDNKTEFLAMFQYATDAERFAKARVEEDKARDWRGSLYVVSCSYSGRIAVFGPTKTEG